MNFKANCLFLLIILPSFLFGQRIIESDETISNSSRKKAVQSNFAVKFGFSDILRGEIPLSIEYAFLDQVSVEVGVSYLIKNYYYFSEWGFLAGNDPFENSGYDLYGAADPSIGVFGKLRFYYNDEFYEGSFLEVEFNDRRYNSTYTYEQFEQPTYMHFTDFSINYGSVRHFTERFCLEGFVGVGIRNARQQFSEGESFQPDQPGDAPEVYQSEGNSLMIRIGYKLVYLL